MGNVLATASDWLARMRKAHAATAVVYRRGEDAIQIDVQKLSVNVELDRGDGVVIEAQRMDWVVAVEDLVFGGRKARPLEGDRIEHWMGSTKNIYEVMPLGTDSHYRPLGPYGNAWRVHSKLVKTE